MQTAEDNFFYEIDPGASGITLSHMNNKSSVLCPETQDITSQYLALQQLDAHQKMISRAKGVVDTSPPKSLQSYRSVSSQQKKKMLKNLKNNSQNLFESNLSEDYNGPSSSTLAAYYSEEEENRSTDVPLNKAIQTGIPVIDFTCKTAEKISWYLEALSLGELQSEYFTFINHNCNHGRQLQAQAYSNKQCKRRRIKGDIMDWHRQHFMEPKKSFSPRILTNPSAKSKIRDMRCYNPPFRLKKTTSSHSSDTFESYEEENEVLSKTNENPKSSDNSSDEEDTLINTRMRDAAASHYSNHTSIPILLPYRRDFNSYNNPSILNRNEEDKYLDFLSKVTEDILRSGVFSDKAVKQAFEFHMQFYKDDPNKEKLHSLLEQVLDGLKVSNDDTEKSFQSKKSFLLSFSRPNTPPEKETSAATFTSDSSQAVIDLNLSTNESVNDSDIENS